MERKKSAGVGCLYAQRRMYARNAASNRAVSARMCSRSRYKPVAGLLYSAWPRSGGGTRSAGSIDGTSRPVAAKRAHWIALPRSRGARSEEHTSELQSQSNLVCRLLLEKKKK